mgnify:CR=1 FL=1
MPLNDTTTLFKGQYLTLGSLTVVRNMNSILTFTQKVFLLQKVKFSEHFSAQCDTM